MIMKHQVTMKNLFLGVLIAYIFLRILGIICPIILFLFCLAGIVMYYDSLIEKIELFKNIYSLKTN